VSVAPEVASDQNEAPVGAAAREGAGAYRWYVIALLTASYATHTFDRNVVNTLVEPIKHEFHASDSALGFMTGLAYAAPFALAGLPLGALVDRVRRQRLLAGLLLVWSGMTALGGVCQSFVALLFSRAAVGAAESGSPPTALALVSDYFPPRLRAFATSIYYVGAPIGAVTGVYITALITAEHGWRVALFIAGVPGALLALLIFFTVREPGRGGLDAVRSEGSPSFLSVFGLIGRNAGLFLILAALVAGAMAQVGIGAWMQAVLLRSYHLPMKEVGALSGISGAFSAAGAFLGGVLGNVVAKGRTERLLVICGVSILAAIPFTLMVLLGAGGPLNLVPFFATALLNPVYYGPGFSLMLSLAPATMRGRMMAVTLVVSNILGAGIGPQIIGWISDYLATRHDPLALPHATACLTVAGVTAGLLFLVAIAFAPRGLTQPLDTGTSKARTPA